MTTGGGERGLTLRKHKHAILALGVGLLLGAVLLGFTGLTANYEHDTYYKDSSEVSVDSRDDFNVTYGELSPREQRVVDNVAESQSSVWTSEPLDSFTYSTHGGRLTLVDYPDKTVAITTRHDTKREVAIFGNTLRVGAAVSGFLLLVLGFVLLEQNRTEVSDRLVDGLERWVPASSFVLFGAPFLLLSWSSFQFLESAFGLLPITNPGAVAIVAVVSLGVSGFVTSTVVFRHLFDVDRLPFVVSALVLPAAILWLARHLFVGVESNSIVEPILYGILAIVTFTGLLLGWGMYALGHRWWRYNRERSDLSSSQRQS